MGFEDVGAILPDGAACAFTPCARAGVAAPRTPIASRVAIAFRVFISCSHLVSAFGGDFRLGALIAFMVTVSGLDIYNIGAPFWGLVFGYLASQVLERSSFAALRANRDG